ncbi:hypothetical protein BGZ61DRAFT_588136 [Ilyonectria robusta]|uniref:uncharacterized protein n=1 Tax=Ilyonectria robusta TaxID=1079257 RepID=UPI001E8CA704|nr:uncharacterized protein BGZ61DRAFT_588136 [Ilyonectria robusta]KAH8699702.1 hypothetical protein BGZ61DRAFT_588136 [Ilyonectria robusta]
MGEVWLIATTQDEYTKDKLQRKREPALKLRPEREQLFKDLSFFFILDNDIAPARRLRFTKAREFGATWTRHPGSATHIIVEKNIAVKDVDGVLRSAAREFDATWTRNPGSATHIIVEENIAFQDVEGV